MSVIKNNKNYGTKVKVKILQPEPVPLTSTYFYVEDASGLDNTLSIGRGGASYAIEVFASTDQFNWTSMGTTSLVTPLTATIPADGKLYLKANTTAWGNGWDNNNWIHTSNYFKVGGNVMSLLNGDNFVNSGFAPYSSYNFDCLFRESNTLINASELQLPATTLTDSCYRRMFIYCSQLMGVPALPATTLKENCYSEMFTGCTSLTTAPVLPATTLADSCYAYMFSGCSSLTKTPTLPATTLADSCYNGMFAGCTRLNSITTYAQDISAENCISGWLGNVSGTGTFYNMACTTYPSGSSGIPAGWTELHRLNDTINVTITNIGNCTGATYQIDSGTAQPINETGTTSFTVPVTATTLTIHRNGKGVTYVLGICGYSEDSDWDATFPVGKMTDNVSIDIISFM